MKKTDNQILSKAVKIIAEEFTEIKGHVQSAALVEASQRIVELDQQLRLAIEQLEVLSNPELRGHHQVAIQAIALLKGCGNE